MHMGEIYYFKTAKVKKGLNPDISEKAPDYDSIIQLNKTYFILQGWIEPLSNEIQWKMSKITENRLKGDFWLRQRLRDHKKKNRS